MPRKSLHRKAIEAVFHHVKRLQLRATLRKVMDDNNSLKDYRLQCLTSKLKSMINSRYLFRKSKNRTCRNKFDLEDALSEDSVHFNDEEFLAAFRMTRESFGLFLEEMKTKEAFKVTSKNSHQRPISF